MLEGFINYLSYGRSCILPVTGIDSIPLGIVEVPRFYMRVRLLTLGHGMWSALADYTSGGHVLSRTYTLESTQFTQPLHKISNALLIDDEDNTADTDCID